MAEIPEGEYWLGELDEGEFLRRDDVLGIHCS